MERCGKVTSGLAVTVRSCGVGLRKAGKAQVRQMRSVLHW